MVTTARRHAFPAELRTVVRPESAGACKIGGNICARNACAAQINCQSAARSNTFPKRRLHSIKRGGRKMLRRRCALGFVDKGAIGARDQDVDGFLARKRAADHIELPNEFALFRKISARMNMLKREIALSCQQHRPSAFTQDHPLGRPRERLDRWLGTEQPPLAIGVAEQPVGFLCADHKTAVQVRIRHQVLRHLQGKNSDRPVANQRVAGAGDAEDRREMTGRRIKDRLRKEERARR